MNFTKIKLNKIFRLERNATLSFLPFIFTDDKEDDVPSQTPTDLLIQERLKAFEVRGDTTGWERVKFALFTPDENGEFGPHVEMIGTSSFMAFVVGFGIGGFEKSKSVYVEFLRTNQATKFDSHMEAKKRLQDRMSIGLMRGGFTLGWRAALFTFMFASVSSAVSLYRNKEGILEYTTAGLAAGMAYRIHLGIRRIIVGGILGSTLGTVTGLINTGLFKIFGFSMSQLRDVNYSLKIYKSRMWEEGLAEARRKSGEEEPSLLANRIEEEKNQKQIDDLKNVDTK
ncbi:RPII140-upstream gene protein [Frankliniella fusca]|uniref:Complex I assembly factor TIMMDC1, mitochondrial n=1 Tax=Frankliniella fusca TaxID=407009 RepID=A0AAE1H754_9NEOP|nr:RPII140-upstream gene protein [Frankliniella fusca]